MPKFLFLKKHLFDVFFLKLSLNLISQKPSIKNDRKMQIFLGIFFVVSFVHEINTKRAKGKKVSVRKQETARKKLKKCRQKNH